MRKSRLSIVISLCAIFTMWWCNSCRIEPSLNLSGKENVEVRFGEVILDLELVWDINTDWRSSWWYGWDEKDIQLWGDIEYPEPTSYEIRLYYLGNQFLENDFLSLASFSISGTRFRRHLDFGFHNVMAWSNVDSEDGTQVLLVDETDPNNIIVTTTKSSFYGLSSPSRTVLNNPEIFYSGYEKGLGITDHEEDYDYYLPDENIWVKQLNTELYPMVYIYLVQVVVYNNHGRIVGVTNDCAVSGLASGVNLHTGRTTYDEALISFEMRMKHSIPARDDREADILGGKLTTFGLCDMPRLEKSRSSHYAGSRSDIANALQLGLRFSGNLDSIYHYDITDQLRRQAHGGVVTIEIDADTITIPVNPGGNNPTGGFDPTIAPTDTIENIFIM